MQEESLAEKVRHVRLLCERYGNPDPARPHTYRADPVDVMGDEYFFDPDIQARLLIQDDRFIFDPDAIPHAAEPASDD